MNIEAAVFDTVSGTKPAWQARSVTVEVRDQRCRR